MSTIHLHLPGADLQLTPADALALLGAITVQIAALPDDEFEALDPSAVGHPIAGAGRGALQRVRARQAVSA